MSGILLALTSGELICGMLKIPASLILAKASEGVYFFFSSLFLLALFLTELGLCAAVNYLTIKTAVKSAGEEHELLLLGICAAVDVGVTVLELSCAQLHVLSLWSEDGPARPWNDDGMFWADLWTYVGLAFDPRICLPGLFILALYGGSLLGFFFGTTQRENLVFTGNQDGFGEKTMVIILTIAAGSFMIALLISFFKFAFGEDGPGNYGNGNEVTLAIWALFSSLWIVGFAIYGIVHANKRVLLAAELILIPPLFSSTLVAFHVTRKVRSLLREADN